MLTKQLVRDLAPEAIGTVRYNHEDCPAGTDTRRRLYVTRKADTPKLILAYCHNCGESETAIEMDTFIFNNTALAKAELERGYAVEKPEELPPTSEPLAEYEARCWPMRYGITEPEMYGFGLRWDVEDGKIILPIYRFIDRNYSKEEEKICGTALLGYQARRYYPSDTRPKYMTCKFSGTNDLETLVINHTRDAVNCVVLVEDMLSAIKVSRIAAGTIPLYGTHIRSERILELSKTNTVIVWLDNDNKQVIKHRDRIASLVKAFGRPVSVVTDHEDPKHLNNCGIEETLRNHVRLATT